VTCDTITAQYPDVGPIETLLPKMQAAAATKDVKTSAEAQMLAARSAAAEMHPSMNLAPFQVQLLNYINIFVVVIVNIPFTTTTPTIIITLAQT
jgi:hypothetical protein